MHKLKIEDLEITTFVTAGDEASPGTVRAHADTEDLYCSDSLDQFCPTNFAYGCGDQTGRPAQTCRASCVNYTCEGLTCGTLIC